jgi:hypothetical protein
MVRKNFIKRAVMVFVLDVSLALLMFALHNTWLGVFLLVVAASVVLITWVKLRYQLRYREQQNQLPAVPPPSLYTRLAELDEALRAGLITQQDYEKRRANIIASA